MLYYFLEKETHSLLEAKSTEREDRKEMIEKSVEVLIFTGGLLFVAFHILRAYRGKGAVRIWHWAKWAVWAFIFFTSPFVISTLLDGAGLAKYVLAVYGVVSLGIIFLGEMLVRALVVRVLYKWADKEHGVVRVNQPTAKFVMRAGALDKVLIQYGGHHLDDDGYIQDGDRYDSSRLFGGLVLFDNPLIRSRTILRFRFGRFVLDAAGKPEHLVEERADELTLVNVVYYLKIEEAEDQDRLPLDIELLVTMRVVNPQKALFDVGGRRGDFVNFILNDVAIHIRDFIEGRTYKEWNEEPRRIGDIFLEELGVAATGLRSVLEGYEREYGVVIPNIAVRSIDPSGDEMRDITLEELRRRREADAAGVQMEFVGRFSGWRIVKAVGLRLAGVVFGRMGQGQRRGGSERSSSRTDSDRSAT